MSTSAFPINPQLTAVAIAYRNPAGSNIADEVLPIKQTAKKFMYTKYSAEQAFTIPDTKVGRKSEPNVVDFGGTQVNDECFDYGLDDIIPNDEVEAWAAMPKAPGAASPQMISTTMLTHLVELDREVRVAGVVFNSASYAGANVETLSSTGQFSDYANSDPLYKFRSTLDKMLIRANTLVLGQSVWTYLSMHPKLVKAFNGNNGDSGVITRAALAQLLEIDRVLVGASFLNTAKKGQAATFSRAWGKSAALLCIDKMAASIDQPTFGFTAQWGSPVAGDINEPKTGLRGSVRVRMGKSQKEVICANDLGWYMAAAVA